VPVTHSEEERPGFIHDFFFRNWVINNGNSLLNFKSESGKSHEEESLIVEQELRAYHKFSTKLHVKIIDENEHNFIYQICYVNKDE
jgi:predicted DNA-binding helix-hairpin-helix protein